MTIAYNRKLQLEATAVETAWLQSGMVEDVDKVLAEKHLQQCVHFLATQNNLYTHRIYVHLAQITQAALVAMQKNAKIIGVLGSETITDRDGPNLYDVRFDFCIYHYRPDIANICKIICKHCGGSYHNMTVFIKLWQQDH